jgi:hypothetical protein
MVTEAHNKLFGDGADRSSKLYWLDVYVNFNRITRQQRMLASNLAVRRPPLSSQYCVLHGLGTVANSVAVVEKETNFDHFGADVMAFVETGDKLPNHEIHRSAKMVWSESDPHSPRLEIYIQNNMLRHLVELYVTKRIDIVIMSMKIAVIELPVAETGSVNETLPLLYKDGHLYFRRAQCELLSVRASISRENARVRS